MTKPTLKIKKRIIFLMFLFFVANTFLLYRLGTIQLIHGEAYKKEAFSQWSRDIAINANRGIIYDARGKKLAVSVRSDTVVCFPRDVMKSQRDDTEEELVQEGWIFDFLNLFRRDKPEVDQEQEEILEQAYYKQPEEIASILSEILQMDEEEIYAMITRDTDYVTLKRWVSLEQAEAIRELNLNGIRVIEDTRRVYPYGNFASHILGFTNIDQVGMYGIERTFNDELTGEPGRWIVNTDANGVELPFPGFDKRYDPIDGLNVVLTIDEVIQSFAESAVEEAYYENNAKSATMIIMNPHNGDVLAMASTPSYDPNKPRTPFDEQMDRYWSELDDQALQNEWFALWRNKAVNDLYEPGSTFKLLTAAIALEENKASLKSEYYCDGYVDGIVSETPIRCWRYYNPHGKQTLAEVMQNSCNDGMADIGLAIGKELFRHYIDALGFGQRTNIEISGEATGIINHPDNMRDVHTVTQSFGQGISVTPIQLTSAIATLANGGKLVKPRLVRQLIDNQGHVVKEVPAEVIRHVFSEQTCQEMLYVMQSVVNEGSGLSAYVPGYSVGGKTGTAQKVVNGRYAEDLYITSFVAVAPTYKPEIVVLLLIDEPSDSYYGSVIAAPIVGRVIEEVLKYMNVPPVYTEEEKVKIESSYVEVPNVIGMTVEEAIKTLSQAGLRNNITMDVEQDIVVKDQYPKAGNEMIKGSVVTLMLN